MTEDEKIHDIAVASIRRKVMNPEEWCHTCFGGLHHSFTNEFSQEPEELVIVSSKISSGSWYVFTTRRLVSCFKSNKSEAYLSKLKESEFGNFKGYGPNPNQPPTISTEVATLNFLDGSTIQFEFETKASMAPIYATKYWHQKNLSQENQLTK